MRRTFLAFALLAACGGSSSTSNPDAPPVVTPDAAPTADAAPPVWTAPTCTTIVGTGGVTFSRDQGATLAPTNPVLTATRYTKGLAVLDEPGRIVAGHDGTVILSLDSGCSWTSIGDTGGDSVTLTAAGLKRAYGYVDNGTTMVRIDDTTVTKLPSPGTGTILGMAADRDNPDHVRIGDSAAQLWDSTDGGETWAPLGVPAQANPLAYRATFDPKDLDHVLYSTASTGALRTIDGGTHWIPSTGTSSGQLGSNVFTTVFSPVDSQIAWAEGLEMVDINTNTRHVWRSTDGGASWSVVLTQSADLSLQNGPPIFAHPTDPNVLYVVFGMSYQNYGTDLYRYDHATKMVTTTHNKFHRAFAIDFLPTDPSFMYIGVSLEPTGG
ncbi:MAG: dispase autolysis-inducing protein [Deltaproteobacteria bacterium]|nr:dispase autolysis-inducing protein [Deltaproteobacteria bacterium]